MNNYSSDNLFKIHFSSHTSDLHDIKNTHTEEKKLVSWINRWQCPMDVIHQHNMSIKSYALMRIMFSCSFYSWKMDVTHQ